MNFKIGKTHIEIKANRGLDIVIYDVIDFEERTSGILEVDPRDWLAEVDAAIVELDNAPEMQRLYNIFNRLEWTKRVENAWYRSPLVKGIKVQ